MSHPEETSTQGALFEELTLLIEPLRGLASPNDVTALVRDLGFDFPEADAFPIQFDTIVAGVNQARTALAQLAAATTDEERNTALGAVASALTQTLTGVVELASTLESGLSAYQQLLDDSGLPTVLPRRLLDYIVLSYLAQQHGAITSILLLLGLVDFVRQEASETTPGRLDAIIPTVHWERLPELFSNPKGILDKTYGWSGDFLADKFLSRLAAVASSLGVPVRVARQNDALADALGRPLDPRIEYRIAVFQEGDPFGGTSAELGLRFCDIPAAGTDRAGIAALPYAMGALLFTIDPAPGWKIRITSALDLTANLALVLRPPDVFHFDTTLLGGGAGVGSGKLGIELRRLSEKPGSEIIIVGEPKKTRLAFREFGVGVTGLLPPEFDRQRRRGRPGSGGGARRWRRLPAENSAARRHPRRRRPRHRRLDQDRVPLPRRRRLRSGHSASPLARRHHRAEGAVGAPLRRG